MKYSHWELLHGIYDYQQRHKRMLEIQCNKNLLKTCYKRNWVKKLDDDTVFVTEDGIRDAIKFMGFIKKEKFPQIGQTF